MAADERIRPQRRPAGRRLIDRVVGRVTKFQRSTMRRYFLTTESYEGSGGTVWFAGEELRAPSVAAYFCGDRVEPASAGRIRRSKAPERLLEVAAAGGLAILRLPDGDQGLAEIRSRAISVPVLVDVHVALPADPDTLREQLLTSTTREDFRRIRRANFTYRVTTDPDDMSEFHSRYYTPVVEQRFPEEGRPRSVKRMLDELDHGGELVCADMDGFWVAGMLNIPRGDTYALMTLGIRDADDAIRQTRVTAALIIRSLERGIELGKTRATLGRSLPFLGKGPVWFKVKWNGKITRNPITHDLHMFMDLRHVAVRNMLAASPVIHHEGDDLVVSRWLEPDDKALQVAVGDLARYPGISRWYVLGDPETLAAGADALSSGEGIIPVPVTPQGNHPVWLSEVLPTPMRPV